MQPFVKVHFSRRKGIEDAKQIASSILFILIASDKPSYVKLH